jgi:hypothetical protein
VQNEPGKPLTKTAVALKEGGIGKMSGPYTELGLFFGFKLRDGHEVEDLHNLFEQQRVNEAVMCAPMIDGASVLRMVTVDMWHAMDRAKRVDVWWRGTCFAYQDNRRAVLALDADLGELPEAMRMAFEQLGGGSLNDIETLLRVLAMADPQIALARLYGKPSCGNGIRDKRTGTVTSGRGFHVYLFTDITTAAEIEAYRKTLFGRLILLGINWVKLSVKGDMLPRSLLDMTASINACRLMFDHDKVLDQSGLGDVLSQDEDARRPYRRDEGALLVPTALAPLTPAEEAEIAAIWASLKAPLVDAARALQVEANAVAVDEMVRTTGLSREAAEGHVLALSERKRIPAAGMYRITSRLPDGFGETLEGLPGKWVSGDTILRNPHVFDGARGNDPEEPDYEGWRVTAKWYLKPSAGTFTCTTFAHGNPDIDQAGKPRKLLLAWTAADVLRLWDAEVAAGAGVKQLVALLEDIYGGR